MTKPADRLDLKYDLFICYRRSDGLLFANWLRRKLLAYRLPRSLDKPDGRRLRVYQDKAYEKATEDFWNNTILPALQESRYLGVVVTTAAMEPRADGQTNWVEREIAAFSALPQGRNIFILDGMETTNGRLPGGLHEKFPNIERVNLRGLSPRWKRLLKRPSVGESLLTVVATLYDALPEEMPILRQEEERRKRRTAWAMALVSLLLLLVMGGLALGWRSQRDEARKAREIALGRQLAAQASLLVRDNPSDLDLGVLLDVESLRRSPTFDGDYQLRQGLPLLRKELLHLVHEGRVLAIAFSRDGRFIATGSIDKTARVFEVSNGKEVARLTHRDSVVSVAFSPDGNYVVTGSYDKTARVFGCLTGKEVARVSLEGRVMSVAYSPDGLFVAAGSENGTFAIFEATSGRLMWHFDRTDNSGTVTVGFSPSGHHVVLETGFHTVVLGVPSFNPIWINVRMINAPSYIAFSADGHYLASPAGGMVQPGADDDESLKQYKGVIEASHPYFMDVRECGSGKLILRLKGSPDLHEFKAAAFSPNGDRLAVASEDGSALVFDRRTGNLVAQLKHDGPAVSVDFSPDGRFVATASRDHTARVFEAATGREVARLMHKDAVRSAMFSPDGQEILTGSLDGSARLFESRSRNKAIEESILDPHVWAVFDNKGRYLAVSGNHAVVFGPLIETSGERPHLLSVASRRPITLGEIWDPVAFSSDGRYLAMADNGNIVDLENGTTAQVLRLPNHAAAFSPDGRYLASGGDAGTIYIVDLKSGSELSHFEPVAIKTSGLQIHSVHSLAFSPDGRFIAVGGMGFDGAVQLFKAANGRNLYSFHFTEPGSAFGLVFSPNGRYLSVVLQGLTKVLDLDTKKELWTSGVFDVRFPAFSPDSRYIATSSADHTAGVFETTSGRELMRIPVPGGIMAVTFTSEGRSLLVASATQGHDDLLPATLTITEHPVLLQDLLTQACAVLSHNLSAEDWQHFLPDEPYQHNRPCANLP